MKHGETTLIWRVFTGPELPVSWGCFIMSHPAPNSSCMARILTKHTNLLKLLFFLHFYVPQVFSNIFLGVPCITSQPRKTYRSQRPLPPRSARRRRSGLRTPSAPWWFPQPRCHGTAPAPGSLWPSLAAYAGFTVLPWQVGSKWEPRCGFHQAKTAFIVWSVHGVTSSFSILFSSKTRFIHLITSNYSLVISVSLEVSPHPKNMEINCDSKSHQITIKWITHTHTRTYIYMYIYI